MKGVGGLGAWRWIFIIVNFSASNLCVGSDILFQEGLFTVVCSVGGYFFIHNYPATAEFLTQREKKYITARLKEDSDATRNESFTWDGVIQAVKDPKVWLYAMCFHTMGFPGYTLSLFLPTIITGLGYTSTQAQLLSIPPYVVAFITTMSVAVLAERTKRRAPFIIGGSTVALVGYIILISSHWPGLSYAGTIIVTAGMFPSTAIIVSWPANNVSGQTKRATASALQISVGNIAAIMGTQLYRPKWSPRYFVGHGMVRDFATSLRPDNILISPCSGYRLPCREYRRCKHPMVRHAQRERT